MPDLIGANGLVMRLNIWVNYLRRAIQVLVKNIPYRRNIRLVRSFRNQKLIKSGYTVKNILRFL